ncbi:MAG TPA: hypothetical protein VH062_05420 [Polyangiaceae bacterium]|jgi:hypothetical protein|nr:hypothetical protein [Polyangiaceae bacterium]
MAKKALAWLLVPAVGLIELAAHAYFSSRPPSPEEWKTGRTTLADLRRHDELVVIAPYWAEPNARYAFGDELMPVRDVARADETAYARAIEVSIIGASAPELAGWKVLEERNVGKLRMRVLANPAPAHVTFDFVDAVADATVADVRAAGAETPCPYTTTARRSAGGLHGDPAFPAARHACSGTEAHFVGVTVVEDEQWHGRRCIWAEPTDGAELAIRFHDVPLGKTLRGHATLPWWLERELHGAPVTLRVLVNGQELGVYEHRDGQGWRMFEMPLEKFSGTRADVEFRVSSRRSHDRQFCFEANTR